MLKYFALMCAAVSFPKGHRHRIVGFDESTDRFAIYPSIVKQSNAVPIPTHGTSNQRVLG
jgi:hypothetical protein